ncbi:hypothetical protein [Nocardia asteroides]|uniref:hypothetical protein n=1 Tax=Nocardia asteroides TaxID=1824 RepID=UPI003413603E
MMRRPVEIKFVYRTPRPRPGVGGGLAGAGVRKPVASAEAVEHVFRTGGVVFMALVGLVRASTSKQENARQHDGLDPICVKVFEEKISGPIKVADRLGRNLLRGAGSCSTICSGSAWWSLNSLHRIMSGVRANPLEGQRTMSDGNDPAVHYFALIDDERGYPDGWRARRITGLVRRTATAPTPTDEALGRDFVWRPTDYLRNHRLGIDEPHEAISAETAERLIQSWRASRSNREPDRTSSEPPPIDDTQT